MDSKNVNALISNLVAITTAIVENSKHQSNQIDKLIHVLSSQKQPSPATSQFPMFAPGVAPTFSGKPEEDVELWIGKFERFLSIAGITDDATAFTCAKVNLNGFALSWLNSQIRYMKSNNRLNWTALKHDLVQQFKTSRGQFMIRKELLALKQSGNIDEHVQKFMLLANQARNCSQQDLASYFIQSLNPKVRAEILRLNSDLETLSETVNAAFRLSLVLEDKYMKSVHTNYKGVTLVDDVMEIDQSTSKKNKRCYACRNLGHFAHECRSKPPRSEQNRSTHSRGGPRFPSRSHLNLSELEMPLDEMSDNELLGWARQALRRRKNQPGHTEKKLNTTHSMCSIVSASSPSEMHNQLLKYEAKVAGTNGIVQVLLVSGSTHHFISERLVNLLNIEAHACAQPMITGLVSNIRVVITKKTSVLTLEFDRARISLAFYVFPNASFEVIVGKPWLTCENPSIDWKTNTIRWTAPNGSDHTLEPKKSSTIHFTECEEMLSKATKKGFEERRRIGQSHFSKRSS
jgi:hypothetical protein